MSEVKGTTEDKVRWRDEDRAVTRMRVADAGAGSGDFAKDVGAAGVKTQQSHMRAVADDAEYDYKAARKTRMARKNIK